MITILGKGIAGLSLAFELVRLGVPVRVIASGRRRRASDCAGGVLATKGLTEPKTLLFRAKLEGARVFPSWLRAIETAIGSPVAYDFSGVFEPIFSADDFSRTENRVYRDLPYHFYGTKLCDHSSEGSFPYPEAFSVQPMSSFFYPRDGWFAPDEILRSLESFLLRSGVLFCEEEVHAIGLNDGVLTIETEDSVIAANSVVVAFGAETTRDLFKFDVEIPNLTKVWGQSVTFRSPIFAGFTLGAVKAATSLLFRDSVMRFSASSSKESLESLEAQRRDLTEIGRNLQAIYKLSTAVIQGAIQTSLVGARALSSDRKPLLGKVWENPHSSVFLYTGLYKNGFQFAPQCSKYLAAKLLGREVPEDVRYLSGFDVSRKN
jgi:glycine/D-amino acid oxidase-like deaminating enzyme